MNNCILILNIIAFIVLLTILLCNNTEHYSVLDQIGNNGKAIFYDGENKRIGRGGLKYGEGSDYDKFKTRRAIGQNRTTGEDS